VSHVLEHLMFRGTAARPVPFARLFDALGSESNALTSYDSTAYVNTAGRDRLNALLALEADRMRGIRFDPEGLQVEQGIVISELQGYANDPAYRLEHAVLGAAFPEDARRLPVGGDPESVARLSLADVQAHYDRYYRPDNAVLVVAGDFDPDQAIALVRRWFGSIERPEQPLRRSPPTPRLATRERGAGSLLVTERPGQPVQLPTDSSTAIVQLIYPLPPIQHRDRPVFDLLDRLLTDGEAALLNQFSAATGEIGTLTSWVATGSDGSWYHLSVPVAENRDPAQVEADLRRAIAQLAQQPPTEAQVARARAQVKTERILNHRDTAALGMQLGEDCLVLQDCNYSQRYLTRLDQITPEQVQQVAARYWQRDQAWVGWIAPQRRPVADAGGAAIATGRDDLTADGANAEQRNPRDTATHASLPPANAQASGRSPGTSRLHADPIFPPSSADNELSLQDISPYLPELLPASPPAIAIAGPDAMTVAASTGLARWREIPPAQADLRTATHSHLSSSAPNPSAPNPSARSLPAWTTPPSRPRSTSHSSAPSRSVGIIPERIQLPNGLTLLLLPDPATPTVTLAGYVQAGRQFDPEGLAGLAEVTAASLLAGGDRDWATTLDNHGIQLTFNPYREGVVIRGSALASDATVMLAAVAAALQDPVFPAAAVEQAQHQAIERVLTLQGDPIMVAQQLLQQKLYPVGHPFHAFASPQTLAQLRREDVVNFHHRYYRPEQTTLALVGDFDSAQIQAYLRDRLSQNAPGAAPPPPHFPPPTSRSAPGWVSTVLPGTQESIVVMGHAGIDRRDARYYSALVLNQILGGDSLTSRLNREIRDRQGMTYGIYSDFQAGLQAGPFAIELQTAPQHVEAAIATTLQLVRELRDQGATPEEVAAARHALIRRQPVLLADPDILTEQLVMSEVYGLDVHEVADFSAKVAAVTVTDVNRVARELLHPDQLMIVTVGPPHPQHLSQRSTTTPLEALPMPLDETGNLNAFP
jgi:predicted Zn-dependent peptidase